MKCQAVHFIARVAGSFYQVLNILRNITYKCGRHFFQRCIHTYDLRFTLGYPKVWGQKVYGVFDG